MPDASEKLFPRSRRKGPTISSGGTPERRTLTFLQILHRWIGYLLIIENIAATSD